MTVLTDIENWDSHLNDIKVVSSSYVVIHGIKYYITSCYVTINAMHIQQLWKMVSWKLNSVVKYSSHTYDNK